MRAFVIVPSSAAPGDLRALAQRAVADAAEREPPDVRVGVEVRDERLQRMVGVVGSAAERCRGSSARAARDRRRARPPSARPSRRARCSRRSGTRSASRRRRGRGRARRPRSRPPRCARRAGRPCSRRARPAAAPPAPCAGRTASAAAGPSLASTSRSTPSTIVSPRSTSPPKSAWPGVSMMLNFVPPTVTAVFLARIVMPFSRSRSVESMTRSFTSWFSRKEPACQSSASTSVVLPWSTWATIATLRRSSRRAVRFGSVIGRPP